MKQDLDMEGLCETCDSYYSTDETKTLCVAAESGHTGCLQSLIAAGADVNNVTTIGNSPLLSAANKGNVKCVKLLLDVGADVNKANVCGDTPLIRAVGIGNVECVRDLLEAGADVNIVNDFGNCAIFLAAKEGHNDCFDLLVEQGADVNFSRRGGYTYLMEAAQNGDHNCVKFLVEAGADVNRQSKNGQTAITEAAFNDHVECARVLIGVGADVKSESNGGLLPLPFMACQGLVKSLDILIKAGADVNVSQSDGSTALMYAAAYRGVNFGIECVKLLLQAGSSVNKLNNKKHNALFTHILNFSRYNFPSDVTHTIPDKTMVLLLFAAGEEIHMEAIKKLFNEVYDKSKVKSVLNYVIPSLPKLCLMSDCREAVRKQMLNAHPDQNLFISITSLPIPQSLVRYLLHDVSLKPGKS